MRLVTKGDGLQVRGSESRLVDEIYKVLRYRVLRLDLRRCVAERRASLFYERNRTGGLRPSCVSANNRSGLWNLSSRWQKRVRYR